MEIGRGLRVLVRGWVGGGWRYHTRYSPSSRSKWAWKFSMMSRALQNPPPDPPRGRASVFDQMSPRARASDLNRLMSIFDFHVSLCSHDYRRRKLERPLRPLPVSLLISLPHPAQLSDPSVSSFFFQFYLFIILGEAEQL